MLLHLWHEIYAKKLEEIFGYVQISVQLTSQLFIKSLWQVSHVDNAAKLD